MKTNFLALLVLLLLWLGFTPLAAQNRNQIIKAVASDRALGDLFGHSASISNEYVIVGADTKDNFTDGANLSNVLPFTLVPNSIALPAINGTQPVITNGNAALTTDQRGSGFSRTKKATVDIGAYESDCISTLTVNNLGDGGDATPGDGICATSGGTCTLRAAIQEANALSSCSPITISFSTNGTITLGSELPDGTGGTRIINGNGTANTIIQANANENTATYTIFTVMGSTADWTLNNLTIRHGGNDAIESDGGGLTVFSSGTLTVSNCIVEKCRAESGGAIFALSATLNVTNSTIRNNRVTDSGGGIYCQSSQFTITNSTITNNQTNSSSSTGIGGGIASLSNALTMTGTTVSNNTVTGSTNSLGGAMYLTNINATDINITDCIFSGNSASPTGASTGRGGGIYFVNTSTGNNNITEIPASLSGFRAVIVYIHKDIDPDPEKAFVDYTKNGGKLIVLHHSISSAKRKNAVWFSFLGLDLPKKEVNEGGYKYVGDITMDIVNLAPAHFITSNKIQYETVIPYIREGQSEEKQLSGFELQKTEAFLNHDLQKPRTILLGFKMKDATGKVWMQDRSAWCMPVEKGWVFYSQPGHSSTDFENPIYARIIANAVIYTP